MKKIFLTISTIVMLFASSSFAQEMGSSTSLKQNMKQLGVLFKAIGSSVGDSTQNAKNAANCEQMNELLKIVLQQTPDTIAELPDSEKAAALEDYQNMIQQEIVFLGQLHDAFANNDNQQAASILQKMGDLRKDGHGKFKE